jgi:Holliday junction resolvase
MASDGSRYERELRNALEANDWRVMRSPASGGGTKHAQPDLLAATERPEAETLAMELKTSSNSIIYLDAEEIAQLSRFARAFDATAYVVCRWKGKRVYLFVPVSELDRTDGGNYRVKRSVAFDDARDSEKDTYAFDASD